MASQERTAQIQTVLLLVGLAMGRKKRMETEKSIFMASIIFIPFYKSLFVDNIFINSENLIQCILVIFTFYSSSRIQSRLPTHQALHPYPMSYYLLWHSAVPVLN